MPSPDRIIAAVNAVQAEPRAKNPHRILRATIDVLTEFRPALWVGCLTTDPPGAQVTRQADDNGILADYVELAQCHGSGSQAPISARVIESGTPLFIPSIDVREFIRQYLGAQLPERESHRLPAQASVLVVPMRAGGAVLGTLGLYVTDHEDEISQEEIVWTQFVADHTALAIEHVRLGKEARDRLDRFAALNETVQAATSTHDLRVVFNIVVERVRAVVDIDACELLLVDEPDDSLKCAASAGFRSTSGGSVGLNLDNALLNQALDSRRVEYLRSAGVVDDPRRRSLFAHEGFVAYAAWPLVSQGNLLGALEIFHRSELNLDAEASMFVSCLATAVALAIQIARSKQQMPEHQHASEGGASVFSPAEWRVLQVMVEGWSNEEIAAQLHLSLSTVKSHVRRILSKSGAANRTDLARRATRKGWV